MKKSTVLPTIAVASALFIGAFYLFKNPPSAFTKTLVNTHSYFAGKWHEQKEAFSPRCISMEKTTVDMPISDVTLEDLNWDEIGLSFTCRFCSSPIYITPSHIERDWLITHNVSQTVKRCDQGEESVMSPHIGTPIIIQVGETSRTTEQEDGSRETNWIRQEAAIVTARSGRYNETFTLYLARTDVTHESPLGLELRSSNFDPPSILAKNVLPVGATFSPSLCSYRYSRIKDLVVSSCPVQGDYKTSKDELCRREGISCPLKGSVRFFYEWDGTHLIATSSSFQMSE